MRKEDPMKQTELPAMRAAVRRIRCSGAGTVVVAG
jgi:hypothetical protein